MNPVLLIAVPLIAAFLSILNKKWAPYILLVVSLFSIFSLYFYDLDSNIVIGGFEAPYGINLVLDHYSLIALYVINIAFFVVIATSAEKVKKMATVLLVALAGLNGLLLTGDLFNLFVFIEVSGIAAYLITTTNKKYLETFNYLVIGVVGSSLYLLGLIILYAMTGTLNMVDMGVQIAALNIDPVNLAFPFLLMFIGLGVEAKLLPFNAWVKGILGNSNKLVGPMIASVYAGALGFVFGRVLSSVFVMSDQLELIIIIILVVGLIAGEAMAFASSKMREVLLYSSVAQASLVIMLFAMGVSGWATFMVIANVVSKFILFAVATHTSDQLGTDELDDLSGMFSNNKVVGVSFTIAALSVSGLPLFVGFVIKMNMLMDLFSMDWGPFLVGIILITSLVEGIYYVRMLIKLWYSDKEAPTVKFDFNLKYVVALLAALIILFGVYTDPMTDYVEDIETELVYEGGIL